MQKTTKKTILITSLALAVFLILSQTALGERFNFPQNLTGKLFSFLGNNEITLKDYDQGYIILVKPKATGSGETRAEAGDVVEIRSIKDLKKKFGTDKPFLGDKEKTKLLAFHYPGELSEGQKEKMISPVYEDREMPNDKAQMTNQAQSSNGETPASAEAAAWQANKKQETNSKPPASAEATAWQAKHPVKEQGTNGAGKAQTEEGESHQSSVIGDRENDSGISNSATAEVELQEEPETVKNRAYGIDYTKILSEKDILIARDPKKGFEELPTLNLEYLKKKPECQQAAAKISNKIARIEKRNQKIDQFLNSLLPQVLAATESASIVDPDNAAGTDYTSLNAWETGEERDLTASGEIAVATCRSTAGSADTTAVAIDGWTTDSDNYIKVWTDPSEDYRHDGKWDESAYRLNVGGSDTPLSISVAYTQVKGIQVKHSGFDSNAGIYWNAEHILLDKLVVVYVAGNSITESAGEALEQNGVSANGALVVNSIFIGESTGGYGPPNTAIEVKMHTNAAGLTFYNCTAYGWQRAFYGARPGVLCKNCIGYGSTVEDFNDDINDASCSHNLSSDDTAPGPNSITNAKVNFVDEINGDFHLAANDANAKNAGTDLSSDANLAFSDDIDGESRPKEEAWDIGADEASGSTQTNTPATGFMAGGLMAYWSFDGSAMDWSASGAELRDVSGNSYHGDVSGAGKSSVVPGRQGQALSFNGSGDYAGVGNVAGAEFRKKITIQSSEVSENLTDFPVYVDLSTLGSDFFTNTNAGCADVRVTQSDGSTEVPREVVSCDTTAETGELHFKAPSLSASSDTDFYIYYGSGGSDYADSDTYGAENVWTNGYEAVYHLEETPSGSGGTHYDSTANANDGTTQNGVTTDATGQLNGADGFDASDDYIDIGGLNIPADSDFTYSMWVNVSEWAGNNPGVWRSDSNSQGDYINHFNSDTGYPYIKWGSSGTTILNPSSGYAVPLKELVHIAFAVLSSDNAEFYANGELKHSNNHSVSTGSFDIYNLGYQWSTGEKVAGIWDEIRISSSARSSGWIATEYNNQNAPGTFYNVGAEETTADPTKTKTISFWIKADDTTSRKVMDIDGTDQIEIDASSNIVATSFPDPTVYVDGSSASATIDSNWHHVVITDTTGVTASALDLARVSTDYFDGALDEIRLYDRVLSSDEISKLYRHGKRTLQLNSSTKNSLTSGLVGHWTFDGPDMDWDNTGAEVRDLSGQANHGAAQNGPKPAIGKQGQALSFDGVDDYVEVPIGVGDIGTISIWCLINDTSVTNNIYTQGDYSDGDRAYVVVMDGDFQIRLGGSGGVNTGYGIDENAWVHLVLLWDAGNWEAYAKGSWVASGTYSDVINASPVNWIGRYASDDGNGGDGYINGKIDDVRIYNRALSESEIGKLYRIGSRKFQIRQ
ncbi:MAG: LamG-like jellyroll fold domain-containing protein [Candidatus Moranbacteria bacterium]|nr:LamG-like jellyroll fold domain-containing protein [Candidatus Moranbacteria bacterium]